MRRKRFLLIVLVIILVTASVFLLFHRTFLRIPASCLLIEDNLNKADVIVVISGETNGERVDKGIKLLKEGYSDKILMSGGLVGWNTSFASIMKNQAVFLGINEDDIILEDRSTTTYENAVFTKSIALEKGYDSILLVTSTYHMRRAKKTFEKVYEGTGIDVHWCSAPVPYFSPDTWWQNDRGLKVTFLEYIKSIWYLKY